MITDTPDPQTSILPGQISPVLQYPGAGQSIPQPQAAILDARKRGKRPLYQLGGPEVRGGSPGLPTPPRAAPLMRPTG